MSKIEEIEKLKKLMDDGALSKDQYDLLLRDIIGENVKTLSKEEQLLADGAITQEQYDILTKQSYNSSPTPIPNSTSKSPSRQSYPTHTNEEYTLVGKTKWLNNCLRVTKYANGNKMPEIYSVQKMEEICNNESGGYFSERFPMTNYQLATYGGHGFLYSMNDLSKVIPKGYRIPNSKEWAELFTELGMNKTKENWHEVNIIWNEFESTNGIRSSFFKEQGFVRIDETGGGLFSRPKKTINIYDDAVAYAMWTRMNAVMDGEMDEGYALLAIGIDNDGNTFLLPNPEAVFVKLVIDETES